MLGDFSTHASLLDRVREGEAAAWTEFDRRYGRLIRAFSRRMGLQEADSEDVAQEVLGALTRSMAGFCYDPSRGTFRGYLKTIVIRTVARKACQKGTPLPLSGEDRVPDPAAEAATEAHWEAEWRQYHLRRAMRVIRREFNETDRSAFEAYALAGSSAGETAARYNLSLGQVYQAKSRILRRLAEVIEAQVQAEG